MNEWTNSMQQIVTAAPRGATIYTSKVGAGVRVLVGDGARIKDISHSVAVVLGVSINDKGAVSLRHSTPEHMVRTLGWRVYDDQDAYHQEAI
jgi:hypothetical protein